jgi:hypothetical protein
MTKRHTILLLASLMLLQHAALACPRQVAAADLARRFPEGKLLHGDLNADGVSDFAVSYSEKSEGERMDRVAIFEGRADGSYCLAAKSGRIGREDMVPMMLEQFVR